MQGEGPNFFLHLFYSIGRILLLSLFNIYFTFCKRTIVKFG